jgi:HK97 family phage major capsid protein
MKTRQEIEARKAELRSKINDLSGDELDKAISELEGLNNDLADMEKRSKVMKSFVQSQGNGVAAIELPADESEERSYGRDSKEYRSAFYKRMLKLPMTDVEQRAMTTVAGSGGAAIPTTTQNKIFEKLKEKSIVYALVSVSHLRGNVTLPVEGVTNDVERKAEGSDGTVQDDTLGSVTLTANKYIKLIKLTCELENTAIDALENYVVDKLVKKFELAFDADIINGDGTSKCKGILKTITPIETATAAILTYDDVCDLFAKLSATAKTNATLIMSTNTLYKRVKKIKDDDKRPIFDVTQNKVLGRDVVECDAVPDDVILFGDFSEYQFNWSKDIEITKSNEAAFASGDIVFRGLALVDGELLDLGAMAALKVKVAA